MQRVRARRARRADLEREGRRRARRYDLLGLRRDTRREGPVHGERRPLRVIHVDAQARLLAKDPLVPRPAAGVAEDEVERLAGLAGLERRIRGLAHPAAVEAEV